MAAMARRGAAITELVGLGEKTLSKLRNHGVETVEQLAQMTPDELMDIQGIGEKTVDKIRVVVTEYFEQGSSTAIDEEAAESSDESGEGTDQAAPVTEPEPQEPSVAIEAGAGFEEQSTHPEQGTASAEEPPERVESQETPEQSAETSLSVVDLSTPVAPLETARPVHDDSQDEENT